MSISRISVMELRDLNTEQKFSVITLHISVIRKSLLGGRAIIRLWGDSNELAVLESYEEVLAKFKELTEEPAQ